MKCLFVFELEVFIFFCGSKSSLKLDPTCQVENIETSSFIGKDLAHMLFVIASFLIGIRFLQSCKEKN